MSVMTGTAATQMFDLFAPGTMLGRNELLATIGEGGMARVILARQRGPMGFEKVVVIKVIHPDFAADRAAVGMLLDEARIAAQISHPNVVQTYELGEAGGTFYIVMEYLAGESLQRILKSVATGASFDPRMAARIIADVAEGLHAAHELTDLHGKNLGLIHRDVSLGNVVVLYNGNVKVVDFGIAKTRDRVSSTTQQGQLKGKYAYMSPEQIKNEPMDRRTDVFSLGVVLWECLALRRLFHAENIPGTLMQILEGKRVAPSLHRPEVPRELDAIALKALEVDPAKRFQSTLEMKRALEDVIWKSRCDAGDVANYMTAVFGDRMRKRQALIASAASVRPEIEPRDATFDDTSGLRPAPLPRQLMPRARPKKRSWIAGAIVGAGVMIGVAGGIRLIGGRFGRNESFAGTTPVKQVAATKAAEPQPVVTPIARIDGESDTVPTLRSRLRPEHLEPVRVELPQDLRPTQDSLDSPGPVTVPAATTSPPRPAPPVVAPAVPSGPSTRELYAKGSELFLQGSFKEAVAVYKQALAIDRGYAPALRGLGLAYQRMGFDQLAIDSFKRYLALSPGAADAPSIQKRIEQLGGTP
jgi:eukaryotic-like serine/threonine-protein kinase